MVAAYEWMICEKPGNELVIREDQIREDTNPEDLQQIYGVTLNEITLDVSCNCSGKSMVRTDKKYPEMESNYSCEHCGKRIVVVWD